jgi:hypothetical protein
MNLGMFIKENLTLDMSKYIFQKKLLVCLSKKKLNLDMSKSLFKYFYLIFIPFVIVHWN